MESKARKVIIDLLDDNSFVEFGEAVTARNTDFNEKEPKIKSDGVITGHGTINDSLVFVYSQDVSVLGGTIGEMHAKKIVDLYKMATKVGAPIIGFIDSNGVRLYESMDAIEAIGSIIKCAADASGAISQILAITGNCGGGLSALASINDYVVMLDDAHMFINSPDTIEGNYTDKVDSSDAEFSLNSGNVDAVCNIDEMPILIRNYIDIAPANNMESGYGELCEDDLNRGVEFAGTDDVVSLIKEMADYKIFVEMKSGIKNVTTGLIRLAGQSVGVVANCEQDGNARLNTLGAYKMADFVNYCDAFGIPILTITNIDGFECDFATEKSMGNALSKLAIAFSNADVPKINLIIGNALGSGYIFMNSKSLGADMVYAYPDSNMSLMDEKKAAEILSDDGTNVNELADSYAKTHCGIDNAARRGIVDRIINPADTRKYLIDGFEMLYSKNRYTDIKKHGAK
ncbi:MAG: carboxyl transferase [Lachnospiraceae bacterium]|nr:carboxyl transferase [Lachnospiraceae bacterium]